MTDTTTVTLDQLIDNGKRHVDKILIKERHKELSPLWHLISPDGQHDAIVVTPWGGDIEKKICVAQVKSMSHKIGAVAVCFMTEAWMLKVPANVPNTPWHRQRVLDAAGRPSESPDRIEVVMIIASNAEGESKAASLQIIRDKPGGRIISLVEDRQMPGHYESWMFDGMFRA